MNNLPPLPDEPVPQRNPKKLHRKTKKSEEKKSSPKPENKSEEPRTNPKEPEDDGWEHYFDDNTGRFFFYNKNTKIKQWLNPRVPEDDEYNQNLPTFEPPKLPFEEESLYEMKLRELKKDPEFKKLSTYEKYKHVEALKKKLEEENINEQTPTPTSSDLQENLKDIKPFSEDTNFNEYGSKSINSQVKQFNKVCK